METSKLLVKKRNGRLQEFDFEKVTIRLKNLSLCEPILFSSLRLDIVTHKIRTSMYHMITTTEIDELAAQTCAYLSSEHPDYAKLAARVSVSNLHKELDPKKFSDVIEKGRGYHNSKYKKHTPLYSEYLLDVTRKNAEIINSAIDFNRDYMFEYFGFKVLERSYLLRMEGSITESPQHMFMRVALEIHGNDIKKAIETYDYLSNGVFIHATPTLFNSGTEKRQLSSCFLLTMGDSIEHIYKTLKRCALLSKYAGGIGLNISEIRPKGAYISGTNGESNGIVPMLKVFNETARYVDQGGGKRKGSFAVYLEPWHADIKEFLELKKNSGKEERRARDLFYALWIPDLFMKRVEMNGKWSLFCPVECPNLNSTFGKAFEDLYEKYENEGKARETINAQSLWFDILQSQVETGTPYMLYKDACNRKSNQQNLGTIRCSNLCTEVIQYTDLNEVAVCNLASLSLSKFVKNGKFDHDLFYKVSCIVTVNLNNVIDRSFYPLKEAKKSNMKHRPIAIGVQGLADLFIALKLPWDSDEARRLNREVFETLYFAAVSTSCELAKKHGPYETFNGSPISKGQFQFDLWENEYKEKFEERKNTAIKNNEEFLETYQSPVVLSGRWDWEKLRSEVVKYGVRNSLLVGPMPTASTSQILGNNECIEPYASNIFNKRVLAGEFVTVCRPLIMDLIERNLWSDEMKNEIIRHKGSIQNIQKIPQDMKEIYKTVWEISQKVLIDMAADRGVFVCQSQSFNLFMAEPTGSKLSSMHFYAWKKGLKTGIYYLRTRPAVDAIQFTVDSETLKSTTPHKQNDSYKKTQIEQHIYSNYKYDNNNNNNNNTNEDSEYEFGTSVGDDEEIDDLNSGPACPIGCDSCGA